MRACMVISTLLLSGPQLQAQTAPQGEQVVIKRAAQLREGPAESSRILVPLAPQTALTRLGDREGAWIKVRMADSTSGWVHMFDITASASPAQASAGSSALRGITSFFNKGSAQGSGSTVATSTLGIRGLGAEDLANTQPNPAAVTQADALRMDAAQARQFAAGAALASRQVEALPVPAGAAEAAPAPPQYSR